MDILRAITGKEIVHLINPLRGPSRFRLFGLISGHYTGVDDEIRSATIPPRELEKLNMGIADVTPADKLFEGLHQFKGEEEEESRQYQETRPLSLEVGDITPRNNVSSHLATFRSSDIDRKKD